MKKLICISLYLGNSIINYGQSLNTFQDNSKRVVFYGVTTLNTTDDLVSSITGSQKFNAKFVLQPMNQGKRFGCDAWIGVNALNLKPTGVDKDSIDLVSLMFPETGNFGFIANPVFNIKLNKDDDVNKFIFSLEGSIALRQSKVSNILIKDSIGNITGSETVSFSVLNYNIMPVKLTYKYQKQGSEIGKDNFNAEVSIGFYGNMFNIPNEDARNFNKLFPVDKPLFKNEAGSVIYSLGAKFIVSLNGFIFYTDLRNNFMNSDIANSNPFKGFVFNTGFATQIEIFSK